MRLFVSIPLSREATGYISRGLKPAQKKLENFKDVRFVPEENWHFTLVFLGSQDENVVLRASRALENAIQEIQMPEIAFEKILYGPPGRKPRMIWATTAQKISKLLGAIRHKIENSLAENGVVWQMDNRPYRGHLTLARFEPRNIHSLPQIEGNLQYTYSAHSVNLMQSILKPTGAEYETLFEARFK